MSALQIDPGAGVEDQRALPTSRLEPSLSCRVPITSGSILAAIEELERTPRSEERFAERYDLYPLLLGPALALLLLASFAGTTVARRVP